MKLVPANEFDVERAQRDLRAQATQATIFQVGVRNEDGGTTFWYLEAANIVDVARHIPDQSWAPDSLEDVRSIVQVFADEPRLSSVRPLQKTKKEK